jgi:phosphoribosylamine--glycine ligase
LFHAGTKRVNNGLYTNGGRVLAATSYGDTMENALESSYELLTKISFDNMVYRNDIGQDLRDY